MKPFFFDGWIDLARIGVTAVLAYASLLLLIRLFGTRSTAKMNNFDWVVTVAMGSLLGSVILVEEVVILEGVLALFLMLLLQYVVTKLMSRSDTLRSVLRNPPCLLFYEGRYIEPTMRAERISKEELDSEMRRAGYIRREEVRAIVLESNAEVSVIGWDDGEPPQLLRGIHGYPGTDASAEASS